MEFNEKLQYLRKQKGITQEELASSLYVSRTAISKWESGRGYPSIDSLKRIAQYFSVTVDELLSGAEILNIAEEENKEKKNFSTSLVFSLLDMSTIIFFFLPFFAERKDGIINEVSLLSLNEIQPYLKIFYFIIIIAIALSGAVSLILKIFHKEIPKQNEFSLVLNSLAVILFTISTQPYAAILLFVFLAIKVLILRFIK